MGESGGGSGPIETGSGSTSSPQTTSGGDSSGSSTGGEPAPTWTEGCFSDDFEDGVLAEMWNTWNELDSEYFETSGLFKFDPATDGLWDAGIVTDFEHQVAFDGSFTEMQVPVPPNPEQPVVLFLQLIDTQNESVAMTISEGVLSVWNKGEGQPPVIEEFPERGMPGWIGIRGVGSQVSYEISDDGTEWTVVAQRETEGQMGTSSPLIMVQTYGTVPTPDTVQIDNFKTCVEP